MNIRHHATIGFLGLFAVNEPLLGPFFIASIAPDVTLLGNELKNLILWRKFDPEAVDPVSFAAYHCAHSLFVTLVLYFLWPTAALGHLIHVVCDWFTHTGRFTAMPFYPFSTWKFPYGREILK